MASASAQDKQKLTVSLMISSGPQRSIFFKQVQKFQREHPEWEMVRKEFEQEYYKANIQKWMSSDQSDDVVLWFAGDKLRAFIDRGWVANIDDLWTRENWDQSFSQGARATVSYKGGRYALPLSYYQWGFYYRKSVFAKHGIKPPENWDDFLRAGNILKSKGLTPVALGSRHGWTVAGWFDYLNLRINGLAFHQELMAGRIAYDSPQVREVFQLWKKLVIQGYFLPNHYLLDWRDALPYLFREKAGMVLMGNFVVVQMPPSLLDDIGFFRFPRIRPEIAMAEEAPMDILIIPRHARNKEGAEAFLSFMGRADVQSEMNAAMGMIPPNQDAPAGDDRFIQAGVQMLRDAEGFSQFYDRDTPSEMFEPGMAAMVQFMNNPADMEQILNDLETIRKKVFADNVHD